jgi:anaerobic selenocysteine-containing dehydrogenase
VTIRSNPPLHVVAFVATRRGDAERGPQVRLSSVDASERLIDAGELVWVYGPRRHEMAQVAVDDAVPRGGVILRDISGVAVSEVVRLEKHRPARD